MSSCAYVPCLEATSCGMVGGCIEQRFGRAPTRAQQSEIRKNAPALNGTKPGRTNRDPSLIARKRKALR